MSYDGVQAFLAQLGTSPELEERLVQVASAAEDPAGAVVAFAARLGHEFTAEEFLQSQQVTDAGLTEAELEGVSGGIRQVRDPVGTGAPSITPGFKVVPIGLPGDSIANATYTIMRR